MIRKKIHYIWLGNGAKPKIFEKCLASWKKYCPGWEIIEWNENNLDLNKYKYALDAYNDKKYAFASDVFRFDILYNEGGVYVDTDVEFLKSIDSFLENKSFVGFETQTLLNPGLICGAVENSVICKNMLEYYSKADYKIDRENKETVCTIFTEMLKKNGLQLNNQTQKLKDITVYSSEYFCPINVITSTKRIAPNTYSIHWYDASWYSPKQKFKHSVKVMLNKLTFGLFGKIQHKRRNR